MRKKFFQTAKTLHKKVLSVHSQSSMMKWGLLKTHSNPMCMYISRHGMTWHFRIILNRLVSRGPRLVFGLTYKVIVYLSRLPKPSLKIRTVSAICWNYILTYLETMTFFRNKTFLFFKIESWNFQHLFEKEFRETSQNFNSIRQVIEKIEMTIVWMSWMSWNFVRFHEILFQTDAESFSFLSWKTKKFYCFYFKKR